MKRLATLLLMLAPLIGACTSWQAKQDFEGWTLYIQSGESIEVEQFRSAVEPAFAAVEAQLGPFEERVRVHAWNGGVDMSDGARGIITGE